ncbi:hypothetical protein LGK95_20790 [Clostridium algoriphilum]|uniref:hypothetical protein n=1 Tax=Clostridium algoriphilum TaxID=198347 RepID=UPI001CF4C346|nr:hypothetical protein [Clostridium algoriphilum]MCB2295902.1 hypothetical protein [Clostridium algoriphilum]
MKNKKYYKTLNKKKNAKTIPKLIWSKLGMLLGVIIPIAMLIAYSMNENFFSIIRILSIFVLIISIAAYLKGEIIYSHPKVVHRGNIVENKKDSLSLNKGTVQVVLSILIIILLTYLVQIIYKVMG